MTRIHFDAAIPVQVEHINGEVSGAFVTVTIGSTQLYLSVLQAVSLRDQLHAKFSVGASIGIASSVSVDGNSNTSTAPADPDWNRFPEGGVL